MSNLKAIRTMLGLTQEELSRVIDCTKAMVSLYESGSYQLPAARAIKIQRYAKDNGHDVSLDWIYKVSEEAA